MKPRIYRRCGIWCCRFSTSDWLRGANFKIGHGYTPREAYLDWKAQQ